MFGKKPTATQPAKTGAGEIAITIDENEVKKGAFLLSKANKQYNDLVWMLAEADLKLAKAFPDGKSPLAGALPKTVRLIPSKIVDAPPQAEIKKSAEALAKKGSKVQELHWFIATRNFILQEAKKKK